MRPSAGKVARGRFCSHSPGFPREDRGFFMRVTLSLITSFLLHLAVLFLLGSALLTLREQPAPPGVVMIEVGLYALAGQNEEAARKQGEDTEPALPPDRRKRVPVSPVVRKSQTPSSIPLPAQKKRASSLPVFKDLSLAQPAAQPQQKTDSSSPSPFPQRGEVFSPRPEREPATGSGEAGVGTRVLPHALAGGSQLSSEDRGNGATSDLRPRCLFCPQPQYPLRARREGWQGQVDVVLAVREDGTAAEVDLRRSSGYRVLDWAALQVARQSRFTPALRQGVPRVVRGRIRYQFRLVVD
jgi:protein TonB